MNFASDNAAGVHPAVMRALADANEDHVASYGADALTRAAEDRIREVLDAPEAEILFVATGTAANAIALGGAVAPWARIFCHRDAHIETSECGAPEMFTSGAKLTLLDGEGGLIEPGALDRAAEFWVNEGLGGGRPGAVSITNATEWGRIWTSDRVAALGAVARRHGLPLHMDGARFANAIAGGTASPAEVTHRAGVDLLSFGGTKTGAMAVEALVAFNPAMADRLAHLRKRGGHLLSKHRYLSAQFHALLEGGLWLQLGTHANAMAALLAEGLASVEGATLAQPAEANQVFATLPTDRVERARMAGAQFHNWPSPTDDPVGRITVRFVCAWNTTEAEVQALLTALRG